VLLRRRLVFPGIKRRTYALPHGLRQH
jgi:hypothetical protein